MYIKEISLAKLTAALRGDQLDIITYINETCDLIEKVEPMLQALLPEPNRRERLLKEAQDLAKNFPIPSERPPLYGVLIGVKDIFNVDGFPTKAGSKLPPELFKGSEALCVQKLKEAGALILGKTVTTEFAYFHPGPTRNPHNIEHTPGGSSSGSAASVAAGFCPLAFGTQTIGSIIRPAAYCGIIGFKPSYNRIPTQGMVHFSVSFDHVGLFTQSVEDMELAASIFCTNWQSENNQKDRLPVLGIPEGEYLEQASPNALNAFNKQIKILEGAGYKIKGVKTFGDIDTINERHRSLGAGEMARTHALWYSSYKELYSLHSAQAYEKGEKITEEELLVLQGKLVEFRENLSALMKQESVDLLISPATTDTAPHGLISTGSPIMNLPWTHGWMPVVNIPVGRDHNNLPWGMQIIAPYLEDEKLLAWSENIYNIFKSS